MTLTTQEHIKRFEIMRKRLPSRVRLEVREVQQALGLFSTSHALLEMKAWCEIGLVEYEEPQEGKRYGTYYLRAKHDKPSVADS